MHYCFLERVGRSRYHGEVTQGKLSLSLLKEDPRTLFYHRKFLLRHKLITKQMHHQKSSGHSCSGSLLHLARFFVERKPKIIFLAEQVIDILKMKENYIAEYEEIKKKLQIENSIQKLVKTSFFQKVVKTDLVSETYRNSTILLLIYIHFYIIIFLQANVIFLTKLYYLINRRYHIELYIQTRNLRNGNGRMILQRRR